MSGERRKIQLPNIVDEHGIPCPECGCRHHDTYGTKKIGTRVMRYRECRHCGQRFTTYESFSNHSVASRPKPAE